MNAQALISQLCRHWPQAQATESAERFTLALDAVVLPGAVREACTHGAWLAGLIAEERAHGIVLQYPLLPAQGERWVMLQISANGATTPSLAEISFNLDWQEREVEDLFDVHFAGHPQLGDFVLHNEIWPEANAPMRRGFDATRLPQPQPVEELPPQILHAEGAFTMTVGPIYSDVAESALFRLDTIGEEIISTRPRFFYKYRALEKLAESQHAARALLLAERLNGSSAIAHVLAYVQALETICAVEVPSRARRLRLLAAELERLRSHTASIAAILKSTGLSVPTNQCYSLLEALLRLCGDFFGHRYLFGFVIPGGVSLDLDDATLRRLAQRTLALADALANLGRELSFDDSFLDRIEQVGIILPQQAALYGLVGPVGRASGRGDRDLRRRLPYADYAALTPVESCESEGDGYARLRVFLAEAAEAARLIDRAVQCVPPGTVRVACPAREGAALGWSEAPGGASLQWLRLDAGGCVQRWRILPPAFTNWHGFHLAAENFAFQDFPITLATVGLSVAEADR